MNRDLGEKFTAGQRQSNGEHAKQTAGHLCRFMWGCKLAEVVPSQQWDTGDRSHPLTAGPECIMNRGRKQPVLFRACVHRPLQRGHIAERIMPITAHTFPA